MYSQHPLHPPRTHNPHTIHPPPPSYMCIHTTYTPPTHTYTRPLPTRTLLPTHTRLLLTVLHKYSHTTATISYTNHPSNLPLPLARLGFWVSLLPLSIDRRQNANVCTLSTQSSPSTLPLLLLLFSSSSLFTTSPPHRRSLSLHHPPASTSSISVALQPLSIRGLRESGG